MNALLVHGIFDTGEVFKAPLERMGPDAARFHRVDLAPADGSTSLVELAHQLRDRVTALCAELAVPRLDLVAFSMGGLVGRYYLQRLGGCEQIARFVTISSPLRGTMLAYSGRGPAFGEMRPGSAFLRDLDRDWSETAQCVQVLNLWTPFDLVVWPGANGCLPGARNLRLNVLRHRWMLEDPRTWRAVLAALAEPV